ncbi:MAG: TIGR04086 family membrane protein [Firmicutes bacterium]|uniref:TIGR04086 family membrane protein n=1 Tax=Sulfobacillus benefaciens TaxID=453960 RepID=A0A2T2XBA3_9FIRM|nr:TIGR04086 family membrane protein [Bacillota bacterium]MCL5015818.1 TIGR04086 family membrane protein [Bacillota bacterium]PSR31726.1 MAG: TIGR04086 family membrane protein [Sulfobacillus benefaciens]
MTMRVGVILRGFVAGALASALIAITLALIDFNTVLSTTAISLSLWLGTIVVAGISGWAAGRAADQAAWIHGTLAALSVYLAGKVIAENLHMGSGNHLWIGLGVSLVAGMLGGIWAAGSQY